MASVGYHEEGLSEACKNLHRGIVSLMEELEAIDWYGQRVDVCTDEELRAVLAHNRKEEIEHAVMTLEWLRRQDPEFDVQLRSVLFSNKPITAIEEAMTGADGGEVAESPGTGSLGIGSLRKGA